MQEIVVRKNLGLGITANFAIGALFVLSAILLSAKPAQAVNQQITFQGKLTDTNSYNVANGTYYLKLTIYDAVTDGSCVYSASSTCSSVTSTAVTVTNGVFSVNLGDTSAQLAAMPATLFNNPTLYLGITVCTGPGVGCDSEMTPRKRITAAPYAFNADYLGGVTTSTQGGNGSYIPATDSSGNLKISNSFYVATSTTGQVGIGTSTVPSGIKTYIESTTASDKLLVIRGQAAQTGNLTEWQDSAGNTLASVSTSTFSLIYGDSEPQYDGIPDFVNLTVGNASGKGGIITLQAGDTNNVFSDNISGLVLKNNLGAIKAQLTAYNGTGELILAGGSTTTTLDNSSFIMNSNVNGYLVGTFNIDAAGNVSASGTLTVWGSQTASSSILSSNALNLGIGTNYNSGMFSVNSSGNVSASGTITAPAFSSSDSSTFLQLHSMISDAAALSNGWAISLNTENNITSAGARLIAFRNNDTLKAFIDNDGSLAAVVAAGYNAGKFNVDASGNVSVSGTLTTFGSNILGDSDVAGGDTTRIYGALALGTTPTGNAQLYISASSTTAIPLVIRGQADQTANLTEWQDNNGNIIGYFASSSPTFSDVGGVYPNTTYLDVSYLVLGRAGGARGAFVDLYSSASYGTSYQFRNPSNVIVGQFGYDAGVSEPILGLGTGGTTTTLGYNFFKLGMSSADKVGKFYVNSTGNVSASGTLTVWGSQTATTSLLTSTGLTIGKGAGYQGGVFSVDSYGGIFSSSSLFLGGGTGPLGSVTHPVHKSSFVTSTLSGSTMDLTVVGSNLYVTGSNNVQIYDISTGTLTFKGALYDDQGGALLTGNAGIEVAGNYAYTVSFTHSALVVIDISNSASPTYHGLLVDGAGGAKLSNPRGVAVSGKYAYIAADGSDALEIVDISDPAKPVHKGSISDGGGSQPYLLLPEKIVVRGKYAYVTDYTYSALSIIDISNPASPVCVGSITGLLTATDLDVLGNYAYVQGGSNQIFLVDISNPANPVLKNTINNGDGGGIDISNLRKIAVSGRYLYATNYSPSSLEIIDVSDPLNPRHKGIINDGDGGALLGGAKAVAVAGNYAYVISQLDTAVEMVDVSGALIPNAEIGSLLVDDLQILGPAYFDRDIKTRTGLSVGGNAQILGSLSLGSGGTVQYAVTPTSTLEINGSINSSSSVAIANLGIYTGVRMYWKPEYAAFRSGIAGSEWESPYIGIGSAAFGSNTYASGTYSFAIGANTKATGTDSFAGGKNSWSGGQESFAFGKGAAAFGSYSFAMGQDVTSTENSSYAFGVNVKATAGNNFVFGRGDYTIDNAPLTNDIMESFMVGFATSSQPALFVSGGGICTKVGIATSTNPGCSTNTYRLLVDANGNTNAGIGVVGKINATGLISQSTSLDLAEKNPIDPSCEAEGNCPEAGDVVMANDSNDGEQTFYIKKSTIDNNDKVLGVVSSQPGFLLEGGLSELYSRNLTLAGRIPVKVSTENGVIKVGDKLTVASSTTGVAMKYTGSGTIIGMALENYNSISIGKIITYVSLGWEKQKEAPSNPANLNTQAQGNQLTQGDLDLNGFSILNIKSIVGKDSKWVIDENGWLVNNLKVSTGDKKVYGMSAENAELTLSGSGQLVNGEVRIEFETATKEIISSAAPLKVSVTLTAPANGVYVSEKGDWGFKVKELNGGASSATFDWVVIARRKTQAEIDSANTTNTVGDGTNGVVPPVEGSVSSTLPVSEPLPADTPSSTPDVAVVPDVPSAETSTSTP